MKKFNTQITIHFDEADPAGIAFSAGLFTKMHRCFETFIAGFDSQAYFFSDQWAYPIRHMEADYLKPLRPLKNYPVFIYVARLSDTSFEVVYQVGEETDIHAQVRSTHVCCARKGFRKSPIPQALSEYLKTYLMTE
jgi:acyl-CoA thioesterase FadM